MAENPHLQVMMEGREPFKDLEHQGTIEAPLKFKEAAALFPVRARARKTKNSGRSKTEVKKESMPTLEQGAPTKGGDSEDEKSQTSKADDSIEETWAKNGHPLQGHCDNPCRDLAKGILAHIAMNVKRDCSGSDSRQWL